jgi:Lon protease-like protein
MAVFPLRGAILLPRIALPLNIFEPRYLEMIDDVMRGNRLIGMIQPLQAVDDTESPAGKDAELRQLGGAGRSTIYAETEDGHYLITLTGIGRFAIEHEISTDRAYRRCAVDFSPFESDLVDGAGEEEVDRLHLLKVLKTYLDVNELKADWQAIHRSSNEFLVNTLSMISPYGPEEKQALLEAGSLKSRAEILVALAEMQLAARDDGSGSALQ